MTFVRRFDHVGITVADLDRAMAFFVKLGLEVEGRMFMSATGKLQFDQRRNLE